MRALSSFREALALVLCLSFLSISTSIASTELVAGSDAPSATALTTQLVEGNFTQPLFVTFAPGDHSRLFVVERRGYIWLIKNGVRAPRPFLDIRSRVLSASDEQGLLGLAFHPNYNANRSFYVNYTTGTGSGQTRISRFASEINGDSALGTTETILRTITQPYDNHNGGMIAFGPNDGFLYVGIGDGGSGGDPQENAQNGKSLLGKMLRLDVNSGGTAASGNPFQGALDTLPEIWAFGNRNPWRFSFDQATGVMVVGDVGQLQWEEINIEAAGSGGHNYGWNTMEGTHCYGAATCNSAGLTLPVYEYDHSGGRCSITGGYVYRGCAIPDLVGTYFFADFCSGEIFSAPINGLSLGAVTDRTAELDPSGTASIGAVSSFGVDAKGELYICDYGNGDIYKVIPSGVPSQCVGGCCDVPGDVDNNGSISIGDIVFLVAYIFSSSSQPVCLDEADSTGDNLLNIGDVVHLVGYVFLGGPPPVCGSIGQ